MSCANNPMDLRSAADMIVGRITDVLSKTDKDTPVVVLMGEIHIMPSHVELQHLVAARLLKMGQKFTFNFENENDYIEDIAEKYLNKPFPQPLKYHASDYDLDGKAILSGMMGSPCLRGAPVANNNLFSFCYENSIPFQFNDAAKNAPFIDLDSEQNQRAIAAYLGPAEEFCTTAPDGVAVRNRVMVERALVYADKVGTNLILQGCGWNHVLGNDSDKKQYEDSLCALFKQTGARVITVLPVMMSYGLGINMLPKAAYGAITQSVIIADMDDTTFRSTDNPVLEAARIREICKKTGGEISFTDVAAKKGEYRDLAEKHVDEMMEDARRNMERQELVV